MVRSFNIPLYLSDVYDDNDFSDKSEYEIDKFDANSGRMIKELKSIEGVKLTGFLDLHSVYEIDNSDNFIINLDNKINSLRSFGSTAMFYYKGELSAVVFIEDWNIDCIPDRFKESGDETSYAREKSNELIESLNKSIPDKDWNELCSEYNPTFGGIFGQTRFVKVRRKHLNNNEKTN